MNAPATVDSRFKLTCYSRRHVDTLGVLGAAVIDYQVSIAVAIAVSLV